MQVVARDSSAFVTKGSIVVPEGGCQGMCIFLHRGSVVCFSQAAAARTRRTRALAVSSGTVAEDKGLGDRLQVVSAPALLGEVALVAGVAWSFSLVADKDCEMLGVSLAPLLHALCTRYRFCMTLMALLESGIRFLSSPTVCPCRQQATCIMCAGHHDVACISHTHTHTHVHVASRRPVSCVQVTMM